MKKIKERDIKNGNVMGPLLLVLMFILFVGFVAWVDPVALLISVGVVGCFLLFCYVWFSVIPRTYNRLVGYYLSRKEELKDE